MKTILAIALTAAATPAFADPVATTPAPVAPAVAAADTQKVCLVVPGRTGSYLNRKVCRTRTEWAKDGIDTDSLRK